MNNLLIPTLQNGLILEEIHHNLAPIHKAVMEDKADNKAVMVDNKADNKPVNKEVNKEVNKPAKPINLITINNS